MRRIAKFFSTICYLGKIPYAPGSFGSLCAFPLCLLIAYFIIKYQIIFPIVDGFNYAEQQILTLLVTYVIFIIFLFLFGIYFVSIYLKSQNSDNQDPSEVIIDELLGQMITNILCFMSIPILHTSNIFSYIDSRILYFIFWAALPFILFRLFDIFKPWPINLIDEKIKGPVGVMLDDIVAALFASVSQYIIIFLLLNFLR